MDPDKALGDILGQNLTMTFSYLPVPLHQQLFDYDLLYNVGIHWFCFLFYLSFLSLHHTFINHSGTVAGLSFFQLLWIGMAGMGV